ncbi:hypothetical protein [Flavobacterium degerlachei]|jgi:uncharacterized membrane protein|uniref:Uncharacterized membrane protein n=1 Tax=Flavobacterium degerlachei TaxID=229203 RepID=A0A1H2U130_9FLAO|nr:hypothetical protein [Flavobacterium degerlachei]SDW49700.1 Uncharacterized membrane protein [Flavobacterium degerlachei]
MNDAHLHLVVNHFPIIVTFLGLGILVVGMFLKNNSVKNTAYVLFVVAAIFALASMATGDGAEEMVEDMPSIGKKIIHEHEELAEKLTLVLYATGLFSLLSLYTSFKKNKFAKILSYSTLLLAFAASFLAVGVGNSGGEIRHTEIRAESTNAIINDTNAVKSQNSEEEE